jgi:hypothetical protein
MGKQHRETPGAGSVIQPLDACCCGASLDFGCKIIILGHSLSCFFYVFTCVSNIVLESPTWGNKVTLITQTFNCAWALATIPFIAFGISGVRQHCEIHLRLYLYWLVFTVFTSMVFQGIFLGKTVCVNMPKFLAAEGGSFACGSMRLFAITFVVMLTGFAAYAIFVVWSRCEELQDGGSEPGFDALIDVTKANEKKRLFQHKSGLFGTGPLLPGHGHPIMYNSLASQPLGGSGQIFSGREHATNFPPDHLVYK